MWGSDLIMFMKRLDKHKLKIVTYVLPIVCLASITTLNNLQFNHWGIAVETCYWRRPEASGLYNWFISLLVFIMHVILTVLKCLYWKKFIHRYPELTTRSVLHVFTAVILMIIKLTKLQDTKLHMALYVLQVTSSKNHPACLFLHFLILYPYTAKIQ